MSETFARGLRSIERRDGAALVRLPFAALAEPAFSQYISLVLSPDGTATLLLPEDVLPRWLAALPPNTAPQVDRGLTYIRASGVCMGGAENKARHILAALAGAGIHPYLPSICDLGLSFAVAEAQAERAITLICAAVPLVW